MKKQTKNTRVNSKVGIQTRAAAQHTRQGPQERDHAGGLPAPPGALGHATHRGVSRLGCQAGGVASDEAVLLIQAAGTLQDAAQSHTQSKVTPASSSRELT